MIQQTVLFKKGQPHIGLSLSRCVKDLIADDIELEDVLVIVAGTKGVFGSHDWDGMISDYCNSWWRQDPIKAQLIVDELIRAGKIVQPRLTDTMFLRVDTSDGHWLRLKQG